MIFGCTVTSSVSPRPRWFHGKITRDQAEQLLNPPETGLFLVRESTNFPGDYTLCVSCDGKVEHYRIIYHNGKLTIDEEVYFENLMQLVEVTHKIRLCVINKTRCCCLSLQCDPMFGAFSCFRAPECLCYLIDHIQFLEQIMNRKCLRGRVNSMLRFSPLTSRHCALLYQKISKKKYKINKSTNTWLCE